MQEFKSLCLPVAAFMKKNCSPHDAVIITDEQIRLVSEEIGCPVSECAEKDIAHEGVDAQILLSTELEKTHRTGVETY